MKLDCSKCPTRRRTRKQNHIEILVRFNIRGPRTLLKFSTNIRVLLP